MFVFLPSYKHLSKDKNKLLGSGPRVLIKRLEPKSHRSGKVEKPLNQ